MVTVQSENPSSNNQKDHQFKENVLLYCEQIWDQIKLILRNIGAYDFIDKIAVLSIKHPYLAISAAICIVTFLLPIIFMLIFILSTILMAFTGFVLIEGTLITIASVILFGCLGAILIVFLFFGVITINDNNGDNGNSSKAPDENETVQKMFVVMERIWQNLKLIVVEILQRIGAYDLYERITNLSSQHPYLAVTAAMALAAFILPFVTIVVFALSTVVLTFSGFAILEGTLIAFISMVLFGCLGAIVLATLFFGGISVAGYFGFLHIMELYHRVTNYSVKTRKGIKESEK